MDKIIKVGLDMILIIGVVTETKWEVTKCMGDRIIIDMDLGDPLKPKLWKKQE